MKERSITRKLIDQALQLPDQTRYDSDGRMLIKKIYTKAGVQRLLLLAVIKENQRLKILTVIDTSKIRKYL